MSFGPFRAASSLFAKPDYRRLWAIGTLSGVARWLEFIALGIFAYELTQSPPLVALLAVLRMAPYVLLGFIVGALADRYDRRAMLMVWTGLLLGTAVAMTVATATGTAGYAAVAAATMMSGVYWTVDMPVRRRLLVDAAGQANVAAALGLDNSTMYLTRALGPLIGGATYQVMGIGGIYAMIAVSYALCLYYAWLLPETPKSETQSAAGAGGLLSLFSIPKALVFNRRFGVIMGVTLVYNLFGFPFTTMVPVIAQKDFNLIPALVGVMSACDGIGGTLGAILVGIFGSERTLFRTYFVGTTILLLLMLGLSFDLVPMTAVAALFFIGACAACFSATQYALVYTLAPPEHRGRATGVLSLFIGTSMIGHYLTGQLFDRFASPEAIRIMSMSGLAIMAVLGVIWLTTPRPVAKTA